MQHWLHGTAEINRSSQSSGMAQKGNLWASGSFGRSPPDPNPGFLVCQAFLNPAMPWPRLACPFPGMAASFPAPATQLIEPARTLFGRATAWLEPRIALPEPAIGFLVTGRAFLHRVMDLFRRQGDQATNVVPLPKKVGMVALLQPILVSMPAATRVRFNCAMTTANWVSQQL